MAKFTEAVRNEMLRLETIRQSWHTKVGHVCPRYETARSYGPHWDGMADPALQEGIGCATCYPPDGRYHG